MSKILTANQRILTGVTHPESGYSRVTGFWTGVLPAIGDEGWEATNVVGERVWLLEVQLRFWGDAIGVQCSGFWLLLAGTAMPKTVGELFGSWERIIPCSSKIKPYYQWDGESVQFTWSMRRLYTGAGRRFALWIQNKAATRWWAQATFTISEG